MFMYRFGRGRNEDNQRCIFRNKHFFYIYFAMYFYAQSTVLLLPNDNQCTLLY